MKAWLARELCKAFGFALSGGLLAVMLDISGTENEHVAPAAVAQLTKHEGARINVGDSWTAGKPPSIESGFTSVDPGTRLNTVFDVWKHGEVARHAHAIARLYERDENPRVRSLASWVLGPDVAGRNVAVPVHCQDLEAMLQPQSADPSAVAHDFERIPESDVAVASLARLRAMTTDQQLAFIKTAARDQDDASIVELGGMIVFDDPSVRHSAIDRLIEIMSQRTGHYDSIATLLMDNAVFMDDGQLLKVRKLLSSTSHDDNVARSRS